MSETKNQKQKIVYNLTKKQTLAIDLLTNDKSLSVLFGGGKGGGKSYFLCLWAFQWSYWLKEFFDIKKPKYPVQVGFLGRKRGVDFNDTTLETFKKVVPPHLYHIRTQEKEIIFEDAVKLSYGGLDDEVNINKFNSAEFAFIGIDQAEETSRNDVAVLQGSLRLTYNKKVPPYKQLYTANPQECWLKEDFIISPNKNRIFIPALPDDNPYLPGNYKETLRAAFEYDPAMLRAYLEGDWDAFANLEDALIQPNEFGKCRTATVEDQEEDEVRIVALDVATKHGDCFTVVVYRYGNTIADIQKYKHIPTTKIAEVAKVMYERKRATTLVVDSDGFGEGVADVLEAQRIYPQEFHGGYSSKPLDGKKFRNLRSQFYWLTCKKIEKGLLNFSLLDKDTYEQVKSQFCSIKVRPPDPLARFQIETKEDMSKRSIASPDLADAIVYSEYGYYMSRFSDIQAHSWR